MSRDRAERIPPIANDSKPFQPYFLWIRVLNPRHPQMLRIGGFFSSVPGIITAAASQKPFSTIMPSSGGFHGPLFRADWRCTSRKAIYQPSRPRRCRPGKSNFATPARGEFGSPKVISSSIKLSHRDGSLRAFPNDAEAIPDLGRPDRLLGCLRYPFPLLYRGVARDRT